MLYHCHRETTVVFLAETSEFDSLSDGSRTNPVKRILYVCNTYVYERMYFSFPTGSSEKETHLRYTDGKLIPKTCENDTLHMYQLDRGENNLRRALRISSKKEKSR